MKYKLSLLFLLCVSYISGQEIKSPSGFLGYELGTSFTPHHKVVDYYQYLSDASDMVTLQVYGETHEKRLLQLAFVSSGNNLAELEQIKARHITKGDNSSIAIVWLSYNVHGNESSSTEASMLTIYKLITEKKDWLKNTIVIIDPCLNPDGRDRYVNWYNQIKSSPYDKQPDAAEHQEPWPGGRPNHYLFDLNRDWAWATQIETRKRLKVYNKWLPHIHVDFHEQGINEPYYFAPAAEPFHEVITPWQREFQTSIGKNHAKYFDQKGWLYFTREQFDLLYPSYGDTYPTFTGSIGMTYEQAGHGKAGLGIITEEGEELTLKDRIAHHTTTGLSTVEISSRNAEQLCSEFKKYISSDNHLYKSYVLQGNTDKIKALQKLLDIHDITYGYAKEGKINGYVYSKQGNGSFSSSASDLVIHTSQTKGNLVKVLFEPKTHLSDSLTYDITAWSLPYAYGLDAVASTRRIETAAHAPEPVVNQVSSGVYGYLAKWNDLSDAKFLSKLLQQGIRVRFTERPFKTGGINFAPGTLIIRRGDNKKTENFDSLIIRMANDNGRQLVPLTSGFVTEGVDMGSPYVKEIKSKKIAVLSGDKISSLNFGEIWYFFEQELNYPVTKLNTRGFSVAMLDKFDVLILPSGNVNSIIKKEQEEDLKSWVKRGGTILAMGNALSYFAAKEGFGISEKEIDQSKEEPSDNNVAYSGKQRDGVSKLITGAILKTSVDNTHPIAFGYPKTYYTLKIGAKQYTMKGNGHEVIGIKNPKIISGFVGYKARRNIENTTVLGQYKMGKGSIVYMIDNPLFRAFWHSGKLFFANALFLE